ncbi:MAG: hypothetical protein K0U76_12455 [Actinomycetia bacterium]|nr:hypothetical protein [Actinomycetes bacterium]MCH9702167.1 hypothetical protein [Actinomycetes bacterium]MCH9759997.1 hypothetical protein [Actinomycetes bacterium]
MSFSRVLGGREFGLRLEVSGFRVDASGTFLLDSVGPELLSLVMGALVLVVAGAVVGVDDRVSVAADVGPG